VAASLHARNLLYGDFKKSIHPAASLDLARAVSQWPDGQVRIEPFVKLPAWRGARRGGKRSGWPSLSAVRWS